MLQLGDEIHPALMAAALNSVVKKASTSSMAKPCPTTRSPKVRILASLWARVMRALKVSEQQQARMPFTLLAAMAMPTPVPQMRIPLSAFPSRR